MAAINGYIDRRSEEKKASGKVWEEAGGLYTGENGVLLQTVQIYTLHYILRGNCGRGREKGCMEEKEAGEAEERERVERGRRGRRSGRRGRRRGRRSGREEREEEWEGGEGGRRSREERKGGEGGRRDRG